MKTVILIILTLAPTLGLPQGVVIVQNQTGRVKQWTSTEDSTLVYVPINAGYVQVIAAPVGTPLPHPLVTPDFAGVSLNYASLSTFLDANPGWQPAFAFNGTGPASPSLIRLAPGIFNSTNQVISNIGPGAPADYFMIGWTGNYASFDAAAAAAAADQSASFLGQSAIATTSTADWTIIPPDAPVSLKFTFTGMTLTPVIIPEPTVLALLALSCAGPVMLRRLGSWQTAVSKTLRRDR